MLISTQFAQRDLSLDPADGALFIRQAVGLRGDVDGDLRCVGQELVQMFLLTGAELLQRAAVRVITGVALLSVRHRQVLRTEGGVRLKAAHTAMRPGRRQTFRLNLMNRDILQANGDRNTQDSLFWRIMRENTVQRVNINY